MMQKSDLYTVDPSTLTWRRSSFTGNNGQCVELAPLPGGAVAVRDSKNPDRATLCFTAEEWVAFRKGFENGEFADL